MTQLKQIVFDVCPDGEIRIESHGFAGSKGTPESAFIKGVLGDQVGQALLPAYFTPEAIKNDIRRWTPVCGGTY